MEAAARKSKLRPRTEMASEANGKAGVKDEATAGSAGAGVSGRVKAAVMMVTLGPEACAQIFKSLDDEDVEILTAEIARLEGITPEMRERVLEEFHQMRSASEANGKAGVKDEATAGSAGAGVSGRVKAAVMMVTLGPEACAQIFKSLDDEDVEVLTAEIARLEGITPEMRERVLEEFHQM